MTQAGRREVGEPSAPVGGLASLQTLRPFGGKICNYVNVVQIEVAVIDKKTQKYFKF
jgi:hypothetical protein